MDREEFQIKLDEINSLVSRKDYKSALEIVNSIDWRRVKNVRTLCMVGEIYAANKKYSESREIFLLAYHRSPVGKTILYRLIEVSIKLNDFDEAQEYYEEFVRVAPKDHTRFILQYKIAAAKKVPVEDQIRILEEHKEKEMTERWSYELAKLYYKAGKYDKCIEACDDLVIWFRDGKYVIRALELKMKLAELTPSQQKIYEESLIPPVQEPAKPAEEAVKEPVIEKTVVEEPVEEPVAEPEEKKEELPVEEPVVKEPVEEPVAEPEEKKEELPVEEPVVKETVVEEPEAEPEEEPAVEETVTEEPVIADEASFQKKITAGIRDIFKKRFRPAEDELYKPEEDLKVMYTAGMINYSDVIPEKVEIPDDIPMLEPEKIKEEIKETPAVSEIPKLSIPKVNLNETASVEDLPIEDKISFNLEDTILAAAAEQGIPVPEEDSEEEKTEQEERTATVEEPVEETEAEEELMQPEEEEEELSEEEELMRFIDEQSKDPNVEERDLVPREEILDDEETKLFKYFAAVPGMREQLVEVLKDTQMAAADQTSRTGNVIIMGNRGSGKTTLFELLVKAICRELKMPAAKVARIHAQQMNGKDVGKILAQLSGGFLLIQDMNQMDADTAEALNQALELPTDGLTVIIEDEKIGMRKFIARNPKLIEKFTSRIAIPVFTNDELVNFAKIYTNEAGYKINEMGILALYSLISDNQKEDEPMTVGGVKKLVDDAIAKAESGTRKLQRNLAKTRLDKDGFVVLYEKDFK
ncbi:MAG: hypothetical protein Q4F24_05290 [Eubacteriales bacterium]|nr:hypothetical protein [Eubacteriales bacterium]